MGLVIRDEGKDKRERLIKLTERAYEMFPKWHEVAQNLEIEAINNIDKDELEIFNNILEKMMKNLE